MNFPGISSSQSELQLKNVEENIDHKVKIITPEKWSTDDLENEYLLWIGDAEELLDHLPDTPLFDLVITSPPYNIGKEYESRIDLDRYIAWQRRIIKKIVSRLKDTGSLCWQVGNFVDKGHILPLDIKFDPIFRENNLHLRNRIVWHFGHGLHSKRRFSGRYEVVLWYTKADNYIFNLDSVRIRAKYPGKRHFKGPKAGQLSGNPLGKNPEDVWEFSPTEFPDFQNSIWNIPNIKSNHVEKTDHPCQFPLGLVERLIKALTNEGHLIFDPFAGVATTGAGAALFNRRFLGSELRNDYVDIGAQRIAAALSGQFKYRPHDKPLFDHTQSNQSKLPPEWMSNNTEGSFTNSREPGEAKKK